MVLFWEGDAPAQAHIHLNVFFFYLEVVHFSCLFKELRLMFPPPPFPLPLIPRLLPFLSPQLLFWTVWASPSLGPALCCLTSAWPLPPIPLRSSVLLSRLLPVLLLWFSSLYAGGPRLRICMSHPAILMDWNCLFVKCSCISYKIFQPLIIFANLGTNIITLY